MLTETELHDVANAVDAMEPGPELDCCLLEQREEQISGLKSELADVSHNIVALDKNDISLADRRSAISKAIFRTCLQFRRLLQTPAQASHQEVIKFPKIDVPTFKGDTLEWQTLWEQFDDSVHSKPQLFDPIKLAYHRQVLKEGPARHVIEGLSGTANNYCEAVTMLQESYDRPRLLHQAHMDAVRNYVVSMTF